MHEVARRRAKKNKNKTGEIRRCLRNSELTLYEALSVSTVAKHVQQSMLLS